MRLVLTTLLAVATVGSAFAGDDALDEANAARAARGLPAFVRDDGLSAAASAAADFRAARRMAGHTSNDFAYVPPGYHADAAGCAAWDPGMGFGACCLYENWTHAGAAFAIGPDGRRYMHLFVKGGVGDRMASVGASVREFGGRVRGRIGGRFR
jgi:hypothetical protein